MLTTRLRHGAAITAAVAALCLLATATATARTKWVDLRVVTHDGGTLAEFRQYAGSTAVRASRKADCFGAGNASSSKRYRLHGANALSVLDEASESDRTLNPLLINDSFVDDGFGLGVCSIGGYATAGLSYWYLAVNHSAAETGPDLIPVHDGDDAVWYFTSGEESGFPSELGLRAPAAAKPRQPFTVDVTRYGADGTKRPAAGATVRAGHRIVGKTGPEGALRVTLADDATLSATGSVEDVPSNHARVCVSAESGECPTVHGKLVYGSSQGDEIDGTRGWDKIKARGGADVVDIRAGGQDRVSCGGGRDELLADRGDGNDKIASSCERLIRR